MRVLKIWKIFKNLEFFRLRRSHDTKCRLWEKFPPGGEICWRVICQWTNYFNISSTEGIFSRVPPLVNARHKVSTMKNSRRGESVTLQEPTIGGVFQRTLSPLLHLLQVTLQPNFKKIWLKWRVALYLQGWGASRPWMNLFTTTVVRITNPDRSVVNFWSVWPWKPNDKNLKRFWQGRRLTPATKNF